MDKWIWANGRGLTQFTALAAQMSLLGNLLGSGTQKRADATADLTGAIEAGNKEDIEKCSKRTVKVTKQHNDDCKRLLRLMGVPVVVCRSPRVAMSSATSEAEAQCAALCKSGKVYGVASEDMDSLTFRAPKFLRHLMDPSSRKIPVMEFDVAKVYPRLSYTLHLKDVTTVTASETALKLIRQHGSIETILENINKDRYQIPEEWPYNEARKLFKEPDVLTDEEQLDIKWISPDEDAVEKIKSAKNKSSQGRLESFFKPVANSSMPAKRKQTPESNTKGAANKKAKGGGGGRKKK
uniref:XPG-I domain-containing protein n=1 Tax=Brassica oleracea var. oleracea TaxID=109376 RepID=A0A0D3AXJ3_BRAOL